SLLATAFRSLTSSFLGARSSSVSTERFLLFALVLLADFCVAFVGLMETSSRRRFARGLLRVWLIASLRAVADPPDVAVGVCERTAVSAPLQLRRGLEDLGAGLLCFVHHLVNSRLAANDVVQGQAGEPAALRVHANVRRQALAPVKAHERPAAPAEEHRNFVVRLD